MDQSKTNQRKSVEQKTIFGDFDPSLCPAILFCLPGLTNQAGHARRVVDRPASLWLEWLYL